MTKPTFLQRLLPALLIAMTGLFPATLSAQQDACSIRISLLTASPGEELYSTFGHSAIRIIDSSRHTDLVYNYGTFDFDDPNFYTKFIRGKLLFYVSVDEFDSFTQEYIAEHRDVTEQVLNLNCDEKRDFVDYLQNNLLPQNRFYKYDFLFDNCTTRLRDLIERAAGDSLHFGNVLHSKKTFRDLIHWYLDRNGMPWSKLGIDLLLGKPTDEVMTPYQVMFLPEYLMKTVDSSTLGARPLALPEKAIIHVQDTAPPSGTLTGPLPVFLLLFVFVVAASFSGRAWVKRILIAFDGFLYFLTGVLGILLLFMWFGTDHAVCRDNFNLLWAWPTNVIAAFYIHSRKRKGTRYLEIYTGALVLLLAAWFFLPQHLNSALLPVLGILVFRTWRYCSNRYAA